jgi:hypothetical protein
MFPTPKTLRRALELVAGFATLRDIAPTSTPLTATLAHRSPVRQARPLAERSHPHRRPLERAARRRRPGAVAAPDQPCLTPLTRRTARHTASRINIL